MKPVHKILYKSSLKFFNSIAFYPIVISISLFIISIIMTVYETAYKVEWIEKYSFLWIKGHENARVILTTIIAGVISFMVFSFSMVMVVLNQASSNLSPRVIPGLITQRPHQIVLGFYLGTIIYGLILLHNIKPEASDYDLPQLGIFIGELLGILCISLFVYFIHSISISIQIDKIIYKIFNDTELKQKDEMQERKNLNGKIPDTKDWIDFYSMESGYYRKYNNNIIKYAAENDLIIYVQIPKGTFLVKNHPFLKMNKKVNEKDFGNTVYKCFIFHQEEYITENPIYGFKQLSEIAVKALSPGINDTGSAVRAIEHLVLLLEKQIGRDKEELIYDKENKLRLIQSEWTFDQMLFQFIGPIRVNGKENVFIIIKLLEAMKYLLYADKEGKHSETINQNIKILAEDAERNIKNSHDKKVINKYIEEIADILEPTEILTAINQTRSS